MRLKGSNGAATEGRILEESLSLIAREGYAAVSMRAIAGQVGINASAIYNHFPTKQAILLRLLTEHMEHLLDAWDAEGIAHDDPKRALCAFVRFHIRYNVERPREVFISYMELRSLDETGLAAITALRKRYETILKDILEAGVARGAFAIDDVHVTAMAILASLTGIGTWYRTGGRLGIDEIKNHHTRLALRCAGCNDGEA